MPRERRYRRRSRRRREEVAVSHAAYLDQLGFQTTAGGSPNTTVLRTVDVDSVENDPEQTTNRKLVSIAGSMLSSVKLQAGQVIGAMLCFRMVTDSDPWPAINVFDPFTVGPFPGSTVGGRPVPLPFARRFIAHAICNGGDPQTFTQEFRMRSRSERLIRPGWKLQAGLYVRCTAANTPIYVGGLLRLSVIG